MKLEQKEKISKSLKEYYKDRKKKRFCKFCGKIITENRKKSKYCSNECRTKHNQVPSLIKYFGFNESLIGTNKVFDEWNRVKLMLEDLYWKEEKTSGEISKMFNYPQSKNIANKIFKYLEIKSRTVGEANHLNYRNGSKTPPSSNVYIRGWHTTWDSKKVYLRSSYEFKFAEHLDKLNIHYTVENLRIEYFDTTKNCKRIAIPDFYIPQENLIIEVKSTYTLKIQNMIDRAKEYKKQGYDFLLHLESKYFTLEDLQEIYEKGLFL